MIRMFCPERTAFYQKFIGNEEGEISPNPSLKRGERHAQLNDIGIKGWGNNVPHPLTN
jgi:hypothetical protein